jgi:hypothetical protein
MITSVRFPLVGPARLSARGAGFGQSDDKPPKSQMCQSANATSGWRLSFRFLRSRSIELEAASPPCQET